MFKGGRRCSTDMIRRKHFLLAASLVAVAGAFPVVPSVAHSPSAASKTAAGHEFWRKERSHEEVKSHFRACLVEIDFGSGVESTVDVISAEPPLVVVHNFLSKTMCEDIVQTAQNTENFKRSTLGPQQTMSSSRTSSTVWLKDEECQGPLRLIAEKVSSISGLPPSHMENLQVVRYQPGQQFDIHTDHNDSFNDLECRGRLATCLIYLVEPDRGGETSFPGLDGEVAISPTQGSALFFWNTVQKPGSNDYSPTMFLNADVRMRHAGLPVELGEKWVCNRWIHPIDFGKGVRGI